MLSTKEKENSTLLENQSDDKVVSELPQSVLAVLKSSDGQSVGPSLQLPADVSPEQLETVLNQLLENDEPLPYSFFVDEQEIINNLRDDILLKTSKSTEEIVNIVFQPQAVFRVRSVARCSSTMSGHTESVLFVAFSPDGTRAASASGDTTVRIWDLNTGTLQQTCTGHNNWVLCLAWSPDGKMLASGGMDDLIFLWDARTGKQVGAPLKGHKKWITSISWEPYHINPSCTRFVSSSKDGTARIWHVPTKRCEMTLSQHTDAVSCVKWSGEGLIYTASRDKSIKVWDARDGKLCRSLSGHAHWINSMALNTDFALKTGAFDHNGQMPAKVDEAQGQALKRYNDAKHICNGERMISGSDDFTMFLWEPSSSKKPIARLTGHQQLVNHVCFSPDGRFIASASFDKSIKLWNGSTGQFITSLRGHVAAVYQVTFSGDSRMLLSASKDSTLKLWDLKTKKLKMDLPGHEDEVYTVDWSPGGESRVVSGGKDRTVKIWRQ